MFIFGDGNQIRVALEVLLFQSQYEKVKSLSQNITRAITCIKDIAIEELNADVIMAGGDDLLFTIEKNAYDEEVLQKMAETFRSISGCTISFGVGHTVEVAHSNLNKAKIFKKTIVK